MRVNGGYIAPDEALDKLESNFTNTAFNPGSEVELVLQSDVRTAVVSAGGDASLVDGAVVIRKMQRDVEEATPIDEALDVSQQASGKGRTRSGGHASKKGGKGRGSTGRKQSKQRNKKGTVFFKAKYTSSGKGGKGRQLEMPRTSGSRSGAAGCDLNAMACNKTDGACYSCGSRVTWLMTARKMDEIAAKNQVANEFPPECGGCGNAATAQGPAS
jgi:hypothetical protein